MSSVSSSQSPVVGIPQQHNNNNNMTPPPPGVVVPTAISSTTTNTSAQPPSQQRTGTSTGNKKKGLISRYETMMDQKVLLTTRHSIDDIETSDGRIRNQEASQRIRDTWIYKQVRIRQDEFIQYQQVRIIYAVAATCCCTICIFQSSYILFFVVNHYSVCI